MWWRRAAYCLAVALVALSAAQANPVASKKSSCPCHENSPEVLQLLRKTGNAFKQVGDILLKKTGVPQTTLARRMPAAYGVPGGRVSYGWHPQPQPHPFVYYPVPIPSGAPPAYSMPPMQYVPQLQYALHAHAAQEQDNPSYPAELSDQLVSLASEYEQAAQNECSCGNVEVNMRPGPSSFSSSKASDIVVEVTLGDLTQAEEQQAADDDKDTQRKKTVNILSVSEASEGGEVETETYSKTSSSASIEEKTIEDTEDTNTIQVVEAIKLQPETSPLQVETFDNTVAAVEKTIEQTVVVKSETEETKTIQGSTGETVINIKTYEESLPKAQKEIAEAGEDEIVFEDQEFNYAEAEDSAKPYEEKVEVVEVEEETLEDLKKEASVVSEIVETVDIEQEEEVQQQKQTTVTETKTVTKIESQPKEDVKIIVVDVEGKTQKNETQPEIIEYEYEYEYVDEVPAPAPSPVPALAPTPAPVETTTVDCVDKDAQELVKYFSNQVHPKYISVSAEKKAHLHEGEHILAERPHPVESVQVAVKGTSQQTFAEGLQIHHSQNHLHHHHHSNAWPAPTHAPARHQPKPAVRHEVPCEAHYGLPKPSYRPLPQVLPKQTRQQQQQQVSYSGASYQSSEQQQIAAPVQVPQQQSYWISSQHYAAPTAQPSAQEYVEEDYVEECLPAPTECAPSQPQPAAPKPEYRVGPAVYRVPQQPPNPRPVYQVGTPVYQVPQQPQQPATPKPVYRLGTPVYRIPQQQQQESAEPRPVYQVGTPLYQVPQQPQQPATPKPVYQLGTPVYQIRQQPHQQQPAAPKPVYRVGPAVYRVPEQPQQPSSSQPNYQLGTPVYQVPQQPQQSVQSKHTATTTTVTQYQAGQGSEAQGQSTYIIQEQQPQKYPQPSPNPYYRPHPRPVPRPRPHHPHHHRQPAPAPQLPVVYTPSQSQQHTVTSKQTTTTVRQQPSQQTFFRSGPQTVTYTSSASAPKQSDYQQSGASRLHQQQQKAASGIVLSALANAVQEQQKSHKVTPAQYPSYYFTAHSNSIYAPPMLRHTRPQAPTVTVNTPAPVQAAPVTVDSAEVVPQRYVSEIVYGKAPEADDFLVEEDSSEDSPPTLIAFNKKPSPTARAPSQSYAAVVEDSAEAQPAVLFSKKTAVPVSAPAQSYAAVVEDSAEAQPAVLFSKKTAVPVSAPAQSYAAVVEDSAEAQPAVLFSKKTAVPVRAAAQSFSSVVEESSEGEDQPSGLLISKPVSSSQSVSFVPAAKKTGTVVVQARADQEPSSSWEEGLFDADSESDAWANGESDAGEVVLSKKH